MVYGELITSIAKLLKYQKVFLGLSHFYGRSRFSHYSAGNLLLSIPLDFDSVERIETVMTTVLVLLLGLCLCLKFLSKLLIFPTSDLIIILVKTKSVL